MGSILTLSACGSGSVALKGGVGEAGADTGVTDAGDSADTADTADSGDSGDSGEHAIHSYIGTLDGAVDLSSSVGLVTCSGTFSIAWDADLRFSGDGTCTGDAGAFAGTISGGVAGSQLLGVFAYTGYGFSGDADVDATLANGAVNGTISDQDTGIAMSLVLAGTGG